MAHTTFVSIRFPSAEGEYELLRKEPKSGFRFFVSRNNALNGTYRYQDVKRDFCKEFEIDPDHFEQFLLQQLGVDLSGLFKDGSKSVAELRVDKHFYQMTKRKSEKFKWIKRSALPSYRNRFKGEDAQILDLLLQIDRLADIPAEFLEDIRVLQQAQSQQKLVIFAGAGVSKDSGLPLWPEMEKDIRAILGLKNAEVSDPALLAQYLYFSRGQKEYNERIRRMLRYYQSPNPNAVHEAIVNLRPRHIITTNFDDLLEKALASQSVDVPYSVIRQDKDFPYAQTDRYLVKMHGDWDLMNFVFNENDYLSYSRNWALTEGFVRGIFASHVVLFVGFSFGDRNLKQILDWVKNILGNDAQSPYLFVAEGKSDYERIYFENLGIRLISSPDEYQSFLRVLEVESEDVLSWRGRNTVDFLSLLNNKNFVNWIWRQNVLQQNILDQLYNSLRSFHAFNSLPSHYFERLFPFSLFNLTSRAVQAAASSGPYHLEVENELIIKLMQSLDFKSDKIAVKVDGPLSEEIVRTEFYEDKLWYVFDKIASSGIYCIHRKGDDDHHRINIENPFSNRLLFPKWLELKFDELLHAIEQKEFAFGQPGRTPQTLRDGLLDGFVLYQMQYFDLAYEVFRKVEEEAFRVNDLALYYLCLRNRIVVSKQIPIRVAFGHYAKGYANQVKHEMQKLDLHEALLDIRKSLDYPVYQAIEEIHFGKIDKIFLHKIETFYFKILDIFRHKKQQVIGPDFAKEIKWSFKILFEYFNSNGLLPQDNSAMGRATEMTFEGLIINCVSPNQYKNLSPFFDGPTLLYCLRWLEPSRVKLITMSYEIDDLPMASEHKEFFVQRAINLFQSGYQERPQIQANPTYQRYLHANSLFIIEEKRLIPNLLHALSLIDLDDVPEMARSLCVAIRRYFQFKSVPWFEEEDVVRFYHKHLAYVDERDIPELFRVIIVLRGFRSHHLKNLARRIREVHPNYRISDGDLLQTLIRGRQGKYDNDRLAAMLEFYPCLTPTLQGKFEEDLAAALQENFDLDLYLLARLAGIQPNIILPGIAKERLQSFFVPIDQVRFTPDGSIHSENEEGIFRREESPHYLAWLIGTLARLHYEQKLDQESLSWFLNQPDLPQVFRWLLAPKEFNYEIFDPYWLFFAANEPSVLKKLAKFRIKALQTTLQNSLQTNYSEPLAKIYIQYFAT